MTWLIFSISYIAYFAIGIFISGILDANTYGEAVLYTIFWPLVGIPLLIYLVCSVPFKYLFMLGRKFGKRFNKWFDIRSDIFECKR